MLDPWIIEKIRRREEEQREDRGRSRVHIPAPTPAHEDSPDAKQPPKEDGERGVIVIDL